MPEAKAPKVAESPEALIKALKKKRRMEHNAAASNYGWAAFQIGLVGAMAVGLFFLWPILPVVAFLGVSTVWPFIGAVVGAGALAMFTGIFGRIKDNFKDGMDHSKQASDADARISKTVKDIQEAGKEKEKKPAPVPATAPAVAPTGAAPLTQAAAAPAVQPQRQPA